MTRTYLVTGGAGFIGSHLTERLLDRGDRVVVLDNLSTGRLENLAAVRDHPELQFVQGSVLDPLVVDECTRHADVVVHLAAAVGVRLIVEQPLKSFTTNIRGAEVVLEAAHRYRCLALVASSSEVYGKNDSGPLAETADCVLGNPVVARWAYATAKTVNEILALTYHRERGLATVVVRLFNTVGPRQSPSYGMVIPNFVRQALHGESLTVFGDGGQSRCFCHVDDIVRALTGLLDAPASHGEVFNLGAPAHEITMADLARMVIDRTASTSGLRLVPYDQAYEAGFEDMYRRVPDTGKVRAALGWQPQHTLDNILDDAIADAVGEGAPDPGTPGRRR
jgi:UDP-glucose 4-epimerase